MTKEQMKEELIKEVLKNIDFMYNADMLKGNIDDIKLLEYLLGSYRIRTIPSKEPLGSGLAEHMKTIFKRKEMYVCHICGLSFPKATAHLCQGKVYPFGPGQFGNPIMC